MLFFGNLLKESGVTRRLANTASGPLVDIVTILIGVTVGASTQADQFLQLKSVLIFGLGERLRDQPLAQLLRDSRPEAAVPYRERCIAPQC